MHIRFSTTLYFIRHGETSSNARGIRQGIQIDDYLDTEGILQVEKAGLLTRYLNLDILFTSYLHRAEESASIINNKQNEPIPVMHDYRLRERDFGSLTGKTEPEWLVAVPDYLDKERLQMYDYRPFGGESVEQVRQRALSSILDIITNFSNKNTGIVTHAGIIRIILFHFPEIPRIYHNDDKGELMISNSDIYEWEITGDVIANLKSLLV